MKFDPRKYPRLTLVLLAVALTPLARRASAARPLIDFPFDEGGGTQVTDLVNGLSGKPGNPSNPPTFVADSASGKAGDNAVQFKAGQYFLVDDPDTRLRLDPADPSFALQAWVKFPGNPSERMVFFYSDGPGGAISFSVNTDRSVHVTTLGIVDMPSRAAIPNDNRWHHIAVVHENGVALRFYVDGSLGDTVRYTGGVNFNRTESYFVLGAERNGGLQYVGFVDRLKAHSGILTAAQLDSAAVPPAQAAPTILDQPRSQTNAVGETVNFSVFASGTAPLSYQWRTNGLVHAMALPGATNASLVLTNLQLYHAGEYSVVVYNGFGQVTSRVAVLQVTPPSAELGTFRVPGTANPWLAGSPNGTSAGSGDVAPAQSPVLVPGIVGSRVYAFSASGTVNNGPGWQWAGPDGYADISDLHERQNGIGGVSCYRNALMGVFLDDRSPLGITRVPPVLDFTVLGKNVTLLAPVLHQPFFIGNGSTFGGVRQRFVAPAGATRLFLGPMDSFEWNNNAGAFSVRVLEADSPPTIVEQPRGRTNVVGETATFSVTATGLGPMSYQWRYRSLTPPVPLTDATNATLVLADVQLTQAGEYSVVVGNVYGYVTSQVAVLTVTVPLPPIRYVTNRVVVSTLAGSGIAGYQDGPGAQAQFHAPNGGCVDAAGNVYVADAENHRIRRLAPDGTVTTLAGNGEAGHHDGPAAEARFSYPLGVCVDTQGTVFVADSANNRIRKISTDGQVTTLAGTEVGGYRDGPASEAWFNFPNDLVVDRAGTIFVTEFDNHTVRRLTPDGAVTTWIGNGTSGSEDGVLTNARLTQPGGIALDGAGNLYVTEWGGHRVRKVSVNGTVTTLAGSGIEGHVDGPGGEARFRNPDGIVAGADGYVYVADNGNHVLRRMDPGGNVATLAGTGQSGYADGLGPVARFFGPGGVGIDRYGSLYVADTGNQCVRRAAWGDSVSITRHPQGTNVLAGATVTLTVAATGSAPLGYRWRKDGVLLGDALESSLVFTNAQPADTGAYDAVVWNHVSIATSQVAVVTVTSPIRYVEQPVTVTRWAGTGARGFADGPGATAQFDEPNGGFVDMLGNVWIADANNHRIRRITPDGTVSTFAGNGEAGYRDGAASQAQFNHPLGVCVDGAGNVYAADTGNNRIRKITPDGQVTTLAGSGVGGYRDGPGMNAWFNFPNDLVIDGAGNLFVSEFDNHTVRKVSPEGNVTTWVGNGQPGYVDGPRAEARLNQPGGIAFDAAGNLYVAEWGGRRIRQVWKDGRVTTLAGDGTEGYLDGPALEARFRSPDGIVVDAFGEVYVTDHGNHAVRRITVGGWVETVAGTGVAGATDGAGTKAQFFNPSGIGTDERGQLYVTDGNNHVVRRIEVAYRSRLASRVLAARPVAYWRLGEASGSIANDGVGTHDGTYRNGVVLGEPGISADDWDTAARFDGVDDVVEVPFAAALNGPVFTVELWVNPAQGEGYRAVVSSANGPPGGYTIYLGSSGLWEFWTGRTDAPNWDDLVGTPATPGAWAHVVATYDGTTKRLYVDGVEVAGRKIGYLPNVGAPLGLGSAGGGSNSPLEAAHVPSANRSTPFPIRHSPFAPSSPGGGLSFGGTVDEVAVYDRALEASEIRDHYAAGTRPHGVTAVRSGGGTLTLVWFEGVLQEAGSVNGSWKVVTNAVSPWTVAPSAAQKYYRLKPASDEPETPTEPENPDPARLVWIPAGTFLMGSPASEPLRGHDEGPQTLVTISKGFRLGKYEVTQREYQDVMGVNPSTFKGDLDLPVESVSWGDATNYCGKLTARERAAGRLPAGYEYRLPTEAQWEYACRAGTTTATAYGNSLCSTQANFNGELPYNGGAVGPNLQKTTKVGSYVANAWGLYDMHGNVWEWCQDWYGVYPGGEVMDPKGVSSGSHLVNRVYRGGGWDVRGRNCRSAVRFGFGPDFRYGDLGFRAALVQVP